MIYVCEVLVVFNKNDNDDVKRRKLFMSTLHDTLYKFTNLQDNDEDDQETDKKNNFEKNDILTPLTSEDGFFYSTLHSSADLMSRANQMNNEAKKRKKKYHDYDINSFSRDFEAELGNFTPFDDIADKLFEIDGDEELRSSLIAQGRKYNQSHSQSGESSEFEKAFTKQESALNQLISDLEKDIGATEKDINNMRLSRVRSPKVLSDLISVKGSLYSTKLAAIKEINSIKKNILDLNLKSKKGTEDDNQASMAASLALQQMIEGDARDSLSDTDYRTMARGSITSINDSQTEIPIYERNAQDDLDELEAEREYEATAHSEGDLYIQYENMNVQSYAEVDENDRVVRLIAKDREGNEIPDYPMPDIKDGTFTIHEDLGTVTDSFHRNYILEKIKE